MTAIELDNKALRKIWSGLSAGDCDFMIFLTQCHFHAVEACVLVNGPEAINELELFVLQAIHLLPEPNIDNINCLLHIGRRLLGQITGRLCKGPLLSKTKDGLFKITRSGKTVLETGKVMKLKEERQVFYFIDGSSEYVKINDPDNKFLTDLKFHEIDINWSFDVSFLENCIAQTQEWKSQRQFPNYVQKLVKPQAKKKSQEFDLESTLIIDKAQWANLAFLVKFDEEKPVELQGYPLSAKGHLLSQAPLFSLNNHKAIITIFPEIKSLLGKKRDMQSLSIISEGFILRDINPNNINAKATHLTLHPDKSIGIDWKKFYWQNLQKKVFSCAVSRNATCMQKVIIENKNSDDLESMNVLFEINKLYRIGNNLNDIDAYKSWLQENNLPEESIYKLSSLAWEFEDYNLAYSLAELEDMTDAGL